MGLSCTQRQSFRSQFGSRVSGELRERFSIRGPLLSSQSAGPCVTRPASVCSSYSGAGEVTSAAAAAAGESAPAPAAAGEEPKCSVS